ncbi:MurT ligase domain-containing protein [Saccharopolyspora gloriosae]|uniref:Lipid II isoglutaminyl synthase (glutamine-hydrolyzing) subunit MurT n=1 Tax=Saccharopolyspora gloriosae TaxID=455344 RepID=A0A840NC86_9PSEU|nr:MurT ligase domain-containing protein [Saccharopolyspora gloriosae]MBB5069550.1 UDP-N-acetylmuramyl tripeptide synthase [Saccharopolyspora gloriosae]
MTGTRRDGERATEQGEADGDRAAAGGATTPRPREAEGPPTSPDPSAPTEPISPWRVIAPPRPAPPAPGGPLRTSLALGAGRVVASMSRRLRLGSGGMIGGRLALSLQPGLLAKLAAGRRIVMITGTNGKTTTTALVAEALRSRGAATSNVTGANMLDGHVAALMTDLSAPFAALEVDELHLAQVTAEFAPSVILLLNLSRDQMDRVGEIRTVQRSLRTALERAPQTRVVANRDDPNIVSIGAGHPSVTWVSGGARWTHDALNCPRCGAFLTDLDGPWHCECGLSRPDADWTVTETGVIGPDGVEHPLDLALPGHVNRINATFAVAAAAELGCDPAEVLRRVADLRQASGRYSTVLLDDRVVRLLLAKNPASWLEMLDLVSGHDRPLILAVNSREADGYDVSWLWDVDFEALRGRSVLVTGDRGLDLAVRLRYAGVSCEVTATAQDALVRSGPEPDVVANYTAFRDLLARSVAR